MYKRLNKVSSIAAQIMEERGIHGFVYCAQLISEFTKTGFDMNAIVLAGVNSQSKLVKDSYQTLHLTAQKSSLIGSISLE